jgi:hypothetical protein
MAGQDPSGREPERIQDNPSYEESVAQLHSRVRQLHSVGWETGAGAAVWARAVSDELARHEAARESFGATGSREAWERLHSTAFLLVTAIHQVVTFEHRIRCLTGDAELARARERFDFVAPQTEALRDLVIHLDEYAVSQGRRQTGRAKPPIREPYLWSDIYWVDGGGTILSLGGEGLNLRTAANAAVELAEVAERVREKYLRRAEHEANAALRRQRGADR